MEIQVIQSKIHEVRGVRVMLDRDLAEIRATIELLRHEGEDTLEAVNDLSVDTRRHLDNLYNAIDELSVKPPHTEKPRRPIGYNQSCE